MRTWRKDTFPRSPQSSQSLRLFGAELCARPLIGARRRVREVGGVNFAVSPRWRWTRLRAPHCTASRNTGREDGSE